MNYFNWKQWIVGSVESGCTFDIVTVTDTFNNVKITGMDTEHGAIVISPGKLVFLDHVVTITPLKAEEPKKSLDL